MAEEAARHAGARSAAVRVRDLPAEPRPGRQHARAASACTARAPGRYRALTALCCSARRRRCCSWARSSPRPRRSLFRRPQAELAHAGARGPARVPRAVPRLRDAAVQATVPDSGRRGDLQRSQARLASAKRNADAYALHRDLLRLRREDPVISRAGRGAARRRGARPARVRAALVRRRSTATGCSWSTSARARARAGAGAAARAAARPRWQLRGRATSRATAGPARSIRRRAAGEWRLPAQSLVLLVAPRQHADSITTRRHSPATGPASRDPRDPPRVAGHQRPRRLRLRHRAGVPTRQYHGLFVPNLPRRKGRHMMIARCDEIVIRRRRRLPRRRRLEDERTTASARCLREFLLESASPIWRSRSAAARSRSRS